MRIKLPLVKVECYINILWIRDLYIYLYILNISQLEFNYICLSHTFLDFEQFKIKQSRFFHQDL